MKSRLEKVATALYAADRADVLANAINAGLNGNRIYRAENRDGTVVIIKTPIGGEPGDIGEITKDGVLLGEDQTPVSSNFSKLIENSIPLSAVAEIESRTVPATRALMAFVGRIEHATDLLTNKGNLSALQSGKELEHNRSTLEAALQVTDISTIAEKMNSLASDQIEVVASQDELVLQDMSGNRLASISSKKSYAVNITADFAMTAAFRTAILQIDAETELVSKVKDARKMMRATEKAAMEERRAEGRRQRQLETLDKARSMVDKFSVSAGQMFVLKQETFHEDHGHIWINTTMIAEKDLDARDFVEILNFRTQGLVRIEGDKEFHIHSWTAGELQAALDLLEDDAGPRPE